MLLINELYEDLCHPDLVMFVFYRSDANRTPPLMPDQAMASRTSLTHSPNRTYILEGPVQLLAVSITMKS